MARRGVPLRSRGRPLALPCRSPPPAARRLGPTPHTTWLTFEVDFAFKSPLYRQVASVFFEEVRPLHQAGGLLTCTFICSD